MIESAEVKSSHEKERFVQIPAVFLEEAACFLSQHLQGMLGELIFSLAEVDVLN
jgi:hypothetical protein